MEEEIEEKGEGGEKGEREAGIQAEKRRTK